MNPKTETSLDDCRGSIVRSTGSKTVTGNQSSPNRAQTNLDFILGVTLLIVSVVFVWMFLPNAFAPFTDGSAHGETLASERAANNLAEGALSPRPGSDELDEDCVVAFFGGPTSADGCAFDASDSVQQRLGLHGYQSVNITVEDASGTVLWWDDSGAGGFSTSGDERMAVGSQHGSTSDVSVARRVVSIDGQRAVLVVRVW